MFNFKNLKEIGDLKGKKIVLLLDLNVPMKNGEIEDDFRVKKTLPTRAYLHEKGAKTIVISHLGKDGSESLAPVASRLNKDFKTYFASDLENVSEEISKVNNGDFLLLENTRRNEGEEKNNPDFAKKLASLGEIYVNDGFSVSHRPHASVVGVPKFLPGFAGLQFQEEVENLSLAFNPPNPFLFILGGAKFETKLPLLNKFLNISDDIFVGGALANDLFKAKGYEVGLSKVSEMKTDFSDIIKCPKVNLPIDVQTQKNDEAKFKKPEAVAKDEKILDIGPSSLNLLNNLVSKAKFILWNGPMGRYEDGFTEPTERLAKMIAESGAKTIIGGADTIASIEKLKIMDKFTFVSTAGGAMLDFLTEGTLPGIRALEENVKSL